MRIPLSLLTLLTLFGGWAQNAPTLAARLNLEALAGLDIVASSSDEAQASYRLVSAQGVSPVLRAVQQKLLREGWAAHPNLDGGDGAAPLSSALRGRRLVTFVQGRELLEVQVSPVGRSNFVSLRLNLINAEPSRPVAELSTTPS